MARFTAITARRGLKGLSIKTELPRMTEFGAFCLAVLRDLKELRIAQCVISVCCRAMTMTLYRLLLTSSLLIIETK
jgi:hypothetical protein